MKFDAAALAYVRYVLETQELTPGALAKKAGISASTLTRALNDPKHKFKLSTTTLEKISECSGINPGPFLEARDATELTLNEAFRGDLYRPRPGVPQIEDHGPDRKWTMLVGEVAANVWRSPEPFPYFDYGPLHLTSSIKAPKDCFAFVVRDESANMLASPGDILFCTRIDDEKVMQAKDSKFRTSYNGPVLVERRSKDAFKVENTLRYMRAQLNGDGWELISARAEDHPESGAAHPPGRRRLLPTVIVPAYNGNDEYRIVGDVEAIIRETTPEQTWLLFQAKS